MLFIRAAGLKSRNDVKATTNLFGAADPFFKVTNDSGEVVAQSVVLFNDLNPQWPPIKLDLTALCDNDDGKAVTISFFDYQSKKEEHELIGSITTSVEEMKQAAKDCQAQRNVTLLNKKESYRLAVDDNNTNVEDNNRARVYIYDIILTTGTPTVGTLFKKKQTATNNNNNGSQDSTTPSSDSTEPESDSSSEEEGGTHQKTDQMENSLQDDLPESVCALSVWSNDSTVGVANGDASPSRSVASSSKTKGGTILMGGCMPAVTEEEESLPTKSATDDDHSIPNLDDYDAPDSPHMLAQQRGAEMAQQADTEEEVEGPDRLTLDIENFVGESLLSGDLIMNETDDDDDITDENESSVDSSSFNDSSVRTDNVRDLLGEIDDILTGFNDNPRSSKPNEAAAQQEVAETVSLPPTTQPALKPRNRIARLMSRKSNVSTPPPRRSTNNHIQSPPELKSFADDDNNFMNADRQPPSSPTAILDLNQKNSDLPTKQKQCLGRPKKEYLSNSE